MTHPNAYGIPKYPKYIWTLLNKVIIEQKIHHMSFPILSLIYTYVITYYYLSNYVLYFVWYIVLCTLFCQASNHIF